MHTLRTSSLYAPAPRTVRPPSLLNIKFPLLLCVAPGLQRMFRGIPHEISTYPPHNLHFILCSSLSSAALDLQVESQDPVPVC